jgi:hypothetical protein
MSLRKDEKGNFVDSETMEVIPGTRYNKPNKIYTFRHTDVVLPRATSNFSFYINDYHQFFKLKSIFWDLKMTGSVAIGNLPVERNTTQYYLLQVRPDPLGTIISEVVGDITSPAGTNQNGVLFGMYRPGQVIFDSWEISQRLNILFGYANWDAVNSYQLDVVIAIETEIISK